MWKLKTGGVHTILFAKFTFMLRHRLEGASGMNDYLISERGQKQNLLYFPEQNKKKYKIWTQWRSLMFLLFMKIKNWNYCDFQSPCEICWNEGKIKEIKTTGFSLNSIWPRKRHITPPVQIDNNIFKHLTKISKGLNNLVTIFEGGFCSRWFT